MKRMHRKFLQTLFGVVLSIVGLLIYIPILKGNYISGVIGFLLVITGLIFLGIGFLLRKKNKTISTIAYIISTILFILSLSLPYLLFGVGVVLMMIGYRLNPKYAEKSIKIFQTIFAISVLILLFKVDHIILLLMVFSIWMVVYLNTLVKKKKSNNFEDKIKNELNVSIVKKRYYKSSKFFNRIGGFILPAYPLMTFINKRWKNRKKEAIIHEYAHTHFLINKGYILWLIFIPIIAVVLVSFLTYNPIVIYSIIVIANANMMVFFEYITFKKTNEIGNKFKIKTSKFTKNTYMAYYIIYTIMTSIVLLSFLGLKLLIKVIGEWAS